MREPTRTRSGSRLRDLFFGAALGLVVGLVTKELDFATLLSFHGDRSQIVLASIVLGSVASLTPLRRLLAFAAFVCGALWILVALTPISHWMGGPLVRRDPVTKADAVFVLASGLQPDGDLTTVALSRLVGGLALLGEGWAPRLVLSELPEPWPKYRDAARELMDSLRLSNEVVVVGPVRTTREEAVAVGRLSRELGFTRVLVVTSPSHSRRASAALEAEGVKVVSVPALETAFDDDNLGGIARGDERIRAFGPFLHEHVGLWYYRVRGWLAP